MKRGVIDTGNSKIKTAVFDGGGRLEDKAAHTNLQEALQWHSLKGSQSVILSSVQADADIPETAFALHTLSSNSKLPFKNEYGSPETLGADRIAAMAAAAHIPGDSAVLVFDIGTCMTIDLLHPGKIFRGGNISPGIEIRLQALHKMTGRLPLVPSDLAHGLLGTDTKTAIIAGVINGMRNEIDAYISGISQTYPDVYTVFCGGDHGRFDLSDKYRIFAAPDFVLQGLYHLLILNEH